MSTLELLVVLLLVVVVLLVAGYVADVVHRHPAWNLPLAAACCVVMVMVTTVGIIVTVGGQ